MKGGNKIKIVTALANPILNKELLKEKEFEIPNNDIQYQEAVLEVLEKDKNIQVLVLSELLPGEKEIKEFIDEILKRNNKIKIIIILQEENQELIHFLKNKKIKDIYMNKKITTEEIIFLLKQNEKEIEEQKEIKTEYRKIFVTGTRGIGKSVLVAILAKKLSSLNKKILIINLTEGDNSYQVLFGKKENNEIIKIEKNIFLWNEKNNFKEDELNKIEKEFDYLFFEGIKLKEKEIKKGKFNFILVLVEPNLLEVSKTQEILKNIRQEKIKIIFNKKTEQSIDHKILKKLFSSYKIIGEIKYNSFFQKLINKNMKEKININKIEKEIYKIIEQIK